MKDIRKKFSLNRTTFGTGEEDEEKKRRRGREAPKKKKMKRIFNG